jgi:flagellar biosynthesis chaperone FliJ
MAEPNGSGKLKDHEERIARLEAARRELEDSLIVMAHLETKSAARVKEHAEFIAGHEQAIREHTEFIAHHERVMREIDDKHREIDEKLNALIDVVGKMQGGIESRPS